MPRPDPINAPFWPLTSRDIARLVGGEARGQPEALATRLTTDSRAGLQPGDLFVGLIGPHFDGGRFATQALAEGASMALVSRQHGEVATGPGHAVVVVDDPLAALQALAAEARRRFTGTVVAITGSNGKTTVKEMLALALGSERQVTASPMSYNSQVGVALSLLALEAEAEVALVECGISQPGEMARHRDMASPSLGILTSIGDAHIEGLRNRETTAHEKAALFADLPSVGWVLVHEGERLGRAALAAVGARELTVGGPEADFELRLSSGGFRLKRGRTQVEVELPQAPVHLLEDAALAAAAALELGASPQAVASGLRLWQPAPMRLEISTTPRGILLINDAYTSDPASMEAALLALRQHRGRGATVAVLGGMAQLGKLRQAAHQRVGRRVLELGIGRLIGVGEGGAEIAAAALAAGMPPERVHSVSEPTEAALILDETCRSGDRVLLKASRPERLERLAALLFDSLASARLTIDLDALIDNFRAVRQAAGAGTGVMAVVKSFGYGLDSVRVAKALERAGADYFAVAYPDEGLALRDHGITTPILVANVLPHEIDKLVRYGLSAQVSSPVLAELLAAEATRQRRTVRAHLKVDTGMGRAGASPSEVLELARQVAGSPWLLLEGLMTHFASADEPTQDDFTREQIRRFSAVEEELTQAGFGLRWVHAAASAALARFPEARFSMVRAGLSLFGYAAPTPVLPQRPVLRLTTMVVAVKELPAGHAVGYGRSFVTGDQPRRIALVALGYSDGYPWALSNRGWMSLRGERCPVVGRVSMDVTTIDVTSVTGPVEPGEEVVVFGPEPGEPSLLELANLAGTIPYELLTRISPRVRRIFRTSH